MTGLILAFRRWRREAAGLADPTEPIDRALVDAALAADSITTPVEGTTSDRDRRSSRGLASDRPESEPESIEPRAVPNVPSIRSGRRLDRLAELEEERRYLLRSLKDLERERAAGDVDDDDYDTLKDGYTVRAAVGAAPDRERSTCPRPEGVA